MSTLALRQRLTNIAKLENGVRKIPKNSSKGPRVQEYQKATSLKGTGWAWCAAFVCWCIREWSKDHEVPSALGLTAAECI